MGSPLAANGDCQQCSLPRFANSFFWALIGLEPMCHHIESLMLYQLSNMGPHRADGDPLQAINPKS